MTRPFLSCVLIASVATACAQGSGVEERTIVSGKRQRTYSISAPNTKKPLPLVVALHGRGSIGRTMLMGYGWAKLGEAKGFIVVAPDALPAPVGSNEPRTWRTGGRRELINDVQFVRDVIADVAKRHAVDRKKVYVVGHSNGGAMAFRVANEMSKEVAAVAAVAFQQIAGVHAMARPVPTIAFVGDKDRIIPPKGGPTPMPGGGFYDVPSAAEFVSRWAKLNGRFLAPMTVRDDKVARVQQYDPSMQFWTLKGQGHAWPGTIYPAAEAFMGPQLLSTDATLEIWKFFSRHRLP